MLCYGMSSPVQAGVILAFVLFRLHMRFTLGSWKSSVSSSHHIDIALLSVLSSRVGRFESFEDLLIIEKSLGMNLLLGGRLILPSFKTFQYVNNSPGMRS